MAFYHPIAFENCVSINMVEKQSDPENIFIRPATLKDRDFIIEFNIAMAKETEDIDLDRCIVTEGVDCLLKDPAKGHYYVACMRKWRRSESCSSSQEEEKDVVIGQLAITFEWSDWRNSQMWWIQSVYVRMDYRRRGVFRKLFQHVQSEARRQGVGMIRLYADTGNERAHQTYESLGMSSHYKVYETENLAVE